MLFKMILESAHDVDFDITRRHRDLRGTWSVEVVRFKWPLQPVKAVVGMHPCVVGRIGESIRAGYEDSRGYWIFASIDYAKRNAPHWLQIFPRARNDLRLFPAGNRLYPKRSIPVSIGDKRDPRPIRRPSWIHVVEIAIRNRERIA